MTRISFPTLVTDLAASLPVKAGGLRGLVGEVAEPMFRTRATTRRCRA